MNLYELWDPSFSDRICLTLLHSVWQMGLLAIAAMAVERRRRTPSAQWSYALHVAVLGAGLAAMPLTYTLVGVCGDKAPASSQTNAVPEKRGLEAAPAAVDASAIAVDLPNSRLTTAFSPTARSANPRFLWRQASPWAMITYLVGISLMLLRLVAAFIQAQRLANQAKPLTEGPLLSTMQSLARRWSMRAAPVLAESERIVTPRVVGLLRPVILLPAAALCGLSFEELELILAHELAHVRRHDMWVVLIQRLAEVVLFYNPALWFLSRRISRLREYCCDDVACTAYSPSEVAMRYAATLVKLVEIAAPQLGPVALAAQGGSPSELRRRVARLLGQPLREPLRLTRGAAFTTAMFAMLLALLPVMARSEAQQTGEKTAAEQRNRAANADATNRFSFGGKVEVLALGTHDENEDRWWDAQGKPLPSLPAPLVGCLVRQTDDQGKPLASLPITWKKQGEVAAGGDLVWRRIVLRVAHLPDDADVTWKITGAHATGGSEVNVNGDRNPKGYFGRYFGIPAKDKTTAVKVGVATGKWNAEAKTFGLTAIGKENHGLVFSDEFETPDGASIIVSHDYFDQDFRVVAFDKQNVLHDSLNRGGMSGGKVYQTRATFAKLKRDDIDHFEFQTRDYEYVEVADLPLEPPARP